MIAVGKNERRLSGGGGRQPRRGTAMVVERREAQRARSRRFAQADRSVARATPEAWADGNIRPRGVAHDPGASRRSTRNASGFSCEWLFVNLALAKLGRAGVARTRFHFTSPRCAGRGRVSGASEGEGASQRF